MRFRNLDNNNDWIFGLGTGSYVQANNAISLDIKTRLLSWVNDCFFSTNDFVDWSNYLDKNQLSNLENNVFSVIATTDGVLSVNTLSVKLINRTFEASYNVTTIYSTNINESFTQTMQSGV